MHSNQFLSPMAVCLALTFGPIAKAATLVPLDDSRVQNISSQFEFNFNNKSISSKENVLQFLQEHRDQKGKSHIRMQQYFSGYPVFGGYAIFHSSNTAKAMFSSQSQLAVNGKLFYSLKDDLEKLPKNYLKQGGLVLQHFLEKYAGKKISEEKVSPMVYVDAAAKAHWAYQLSALIEEDHKIPQRPTAILDAETGKIYMQWNDIKTAWSKVKGMGFGGNGKMGTYQYGKDYPYLELTRQDDLEKCYLENLDTKVINFNHQWNLPESAMSFSCKKKSDGLNIFWTGKKGDGYDKANGALSPSNDALYAGYVIKNMYKDWYQVDVLKQANGLPMQLVMRVHYGKDYENAFWDGKQMTFGDGEETMYPLVSIGVGAHEISHGFTEQNSGLVYVFQSGGMNESFSDMAAQAAEYYATGKNSWYIGYEIMKYEEVMRFMEHPSLDQMSIESAADYMDFYGVHYTSGVYNRLFYLMSTNPGWNTRKAFDVMVKANMDYWIPDETFIGGACGILAAAKDLGYGIEEIHASLKEVAIDYSSCK